MEFESLLSQVKELPLFPSSLLQAGEVYPGSVQKQLSLWTASGKLLQIRRGLYMLAEPYRQTDPHPFLIANHLIAPSYVSLQAALAYYELIPETVPAVTSITSRRRTKTVETSLGRFDYHHLQPHLFSGFHLLTTGSGQPIFIARPEKALLDLIYLTPGGDQSPFIESLRLQNVDQLDLDWMRAFSKAFGKAKLIHATDNLSQLIHSEG